ncbi:MAG TPA: MOSC domain-containing protein [Candidatus Binatia bacterium]|nr:MOSC domain-containing protein [Candidatus Binatia bacterium]
MGRIVALYRYPVKGFSPEACESLTVLDEGRIAGDRVLGIRFADTEAADDVWSKKTGMIALINTPGLARLRLGFDHKALRLRVQVDGEILVDERLDHEGRKRVAAAIADYALSLDENPLSGHPQRLPLRVVGDGIVPRYHDDEAGRVTLHGRGSLRALAAALGNAEVNELRFRSNIAVDGLAPWEEQKWAGQRVRVGAVEFEVIKPKLRCLATHANPDTGKRDQPILTTLTGVIEQEKPTFAVAMMPTGGGGKINVGDPVMLVE